MVAMSCLAVVLSVPCCMRLSVTRWCCLLSLEWVKQFKLITQAGRNKLLTNQTLKARDQVKWRFWAAVCKTVALCYRMSVYCGQTVGRIKMKLALQVGLSPGHIVLDGDPAHPPPKGHNPHFSVHVYCGQTVAHVSYCWAPVFLVMHMPDLKYMYIALSERSC